MEGERGGSKDGNKKRRTNVNLVSLKQLPVNHFLRQLDPCPVIGVPTGPDRDFDLLGVEDVSNNALFQSGTVLGYLVVEPIHLLDCLLRLRHIPQVLIAPLSDPGGLSIDGLPQPVKHLGPGLNGAYAAADLAHHSLDSVIKGPATERNNLLKRLA